LSKSFWFKKESSSWPIESRDNSISSIVFRKKFNQLNAQNYQILFSTLSRLVSSGDGMRRCVVLGISRFISKLVAQITQLDENFISTLMSFFGQLINDDEFRRLFAEAFFLNCLNIINFLKASIGDKKQI
jgi:hypothetical protein